MISAIIKLRKSTPVSYNSADSKKRERYKGTIVEAFSRNYNGNDGTDLDADNISKPVWDALIGTIYEDDKQIVQRTSTVIYTKKHNLIQINGNSDTSAELLQILTGNNVKCIYVECGYFKETMIEIEKEDLYED